MKTWKAPALAAALALAGVAGCNPNQGSSGESEEYPDRPMEVVAAADPGGGLDILSREIKDSLPATGIYDGTMTVTNLGGGGGNPAMAVGRERRGDEYTLIVNSNRVFLNPMIGNTDLEMGTDFVPIAKMMTEWLVLAVRADSPYQTATDVMDAVAADSESVSFGVGTVPGDDQLNILKAAEASGIDPALAKIVAFSSGGDLMTQLLGGHVDVVSTGLSEALPQYESGDVRLLAISSPERQTGPAADIPTWQEQGIDVVTEHWRGVFGPADMPQRAIDYWVEALGQLVETDEWQQVLERHQWAPLFQEADEFDQAITEEQAAAEELLSQVGLTEG